MDYTPPFCFFSFLFSASLSSDTALETSKLPFFFFFFFFFYISFLHSPLIWSSLPFARLYTPLLSLIARQSFILILICAINFPHPHHISKWRRNNLQNQRPVLLVLLKVELQSLKKLRMILWKQNPKNPRNRVSVTLHITHFIACERKS